MLLAYYMDRVCHGYTAGREFEHIPISGMGTYCTVIAVVLYETCDTFSTHGLFV